jgi:hypothetical protein
VVVVTWCANEGGNRGCLSGPDDCRKFERLGTIWESCSEYAYSVLQFLNMIEEDGTMRPEYDSENDEDEE